MIYLHDLQFSFHPLPETLCSCHFKAHLSAEAQSALIGQLVLSVVTGRLLGACVGNLTALTITGFQLPRLHEQL